METLLEKSYKLRNYQHNLIEEIFACWGAGNRRVLAQLPTGGGKTVVISAIAQKFILEGKKVLFLAHREELLLQAKEKLEIITGCTTGLIKAGYRAEPKHQIQIASVQSLVRRQQEFEAALVIVDEAHHSPSNTYTKLLERYSNAYVLGMTATPARSDGQGFKNQFDALILGQSVQELIHAGHLCPFKLFAAKNRIKAFDIKTIGGDFNQRELAQRVNTMLTMGDIIGTWQRYALCKKTVVFCVNIAHSEMVAAAFLNAGYAAEHIDGEKSAIERRAILERFRTGETAVLTNCGIFSEGLDVPGIEVIQCLRPTRSLVLYLQMMGRGLRPSADKNHLIILDHTENWIYHGLPDEKHEWSLDPVSVRNLNKTVECFKCQHCFKPLPHELNSRKVFCPNCGAIIELDPPSESVAVERHILHENDADLEEINTNCNPIVSTLLHNLKAMQEQHNHKPIWIYHKLVESHPNLELEDLQECAKILGYKQGWAWYRWQELAQVL